MKFVITIPDGTKKPFPVLIGSSGPSPVDTDNNERVARECRLRNYRKCPVVEDDDYSVSGVLSLDPSLSRILCLRSKPYFFMLI